jgi:hypothetical protein
VVRSAILCPGPSLRSTIPSSWDLFNQVVAVTDGIFANAPLSAWCYQEGPGHPHQERYRHYAGTLKELLVPVWCVKGSASQWIERWGIQGDLVSDEYDIFDLLNKLPYTSKKWISTARKNVRPFGGSSMFYALARLLAEGSRDIHIYGCDFDGYGNFDPRTGLAEVSPRAKAWWTDRWTLERNLLEDLMEEAGPHGISITVYRAKYDISQAKAEAYMDTEGWL